MDIKSELKKVDNQINKLSKNYVDTRGKAQITNLLDKVQNRQKLPNFISSVTVKDLKEPIEIDLIRFLQGINTEVPDNDVGTLKKLEKKRIALVLLLESENEE